MVNKVLVVEDEQLLAQNLQDYLLAQALDVTMREVRLGNIVNPTVISLEDTVCSRMPTIPTPPSAPPPSRRAAGR